MGCVTKVFVKTTGLGSWAGPWIAVFGGEVIWKTRSHGLLKQKLCVSSVSLSPFPGPPTKGAYQKGHKVSLE